MHGWLLVSIWFQVKSWSQFWDQAHMGSLLNRETASPSPLLRYFFFSLSNKFSRKILVYCIQNVEKPKFLKATRGGKKTIPTEKGNMDDYRCLVRNCKSFKTMEWHQCARKEGKGLSFQNSTASENNL